MEAIFKHTLFIQQKNAVVQIFTEGKHLMFKNNEKRTS